MIDPESAPFTARGLHEQFTAAAIETRPLWKPMHQQPVFATRGTLDGTSDRLFERGLTLPSGSAMSEEQFSRVTSVLAAAGMARARS